MLWMGLLLLAGYCFFGISRLKLDNNLLSIMPTHIENKEYTTQLSDLQSNRNIVLVLHAPAPSDTALTMLLDNAAWWDSTLHSSTFLSLALDLNRIRLSDSDQRLIYDSIFYNLPLLLDSSDYTQLSAKLTPTGIQKTIEQNARLNSGYSGIALRQYLQKDPLHLTALVLNKLKSFQAYPGLKQVNGFLVSEDEQTLLINLPAYPGNASDDALLDSLNRLKKSSTARFDIDSYLLGAPVATKLNKDRSIRDSIFTGIISLAFILLLLWYFFRNRSVPLIALFPAIGGFAFALATIGFIGVPLVAMAMSAGTIILAMGINYAIHLVNAYHFSKDREDAIGEITKPMLIGNITTVLAFYMLHSSSSLLLRQYSILAVLSLLMGVLITLVVLPLWLPEKKTSLQLPRWVVKFSNYEFHKNKWYVVAMILGTIILLPFASKITFQGNMDSLNYIPKEEKIGMDLLQNKLKLHLSTVNLVVSGDHLDNILTNYNLARRQLISKNPKLIIPDIIAIAPSAESQYAGAELWKNFWSDSLVGLINTSLQSSPENKEATQISIFLSRLSLFDTLAVPERLSPILREKIAGQFFSTSGRDQMRLEVPVIGKIPEIRSQTNFSLFNRHDFTTKIAHYIQDDFNNILWASAIIVFLLLLFFYGRIELALLAFLPMAISWVWILGLAHLLGIEIHIVNLILCTFIFGLCDDYSIFMVDGLTKEYKYGIRVISRDRQIILISILVTVISLAALFFGKHPAFHSFALLAIIGLAVVLFQSLILQPWLYDYFITARTSRGNMPATLITTLFSTLTFSLFILSGLVLSVLGLVLKVTFLMRLTFIRRIFLKLIQLSARFVVWTSYYAHVDIENRNYFDPTRPGIFIANHQSHIDLLALPRITSRMVVMTNTWVYNNPVYGGMVRAAGYLPGFENVENIMDQARENIEKGFSILIFPEGSRSPNNELKRFHKGAFYLAEKLNVPIYPVLVQGLTNLLTKGEQHIKPGVGTLKLLPAINPEERSWGETYSERARTITAYFKREYNLHRDRMETPENNFKTLTRNYLYKGPLLYWYAKIKTLHEHLFIQLNALIPRQATIIDIGTGYGMLPLMLAMCGRNRIITGIDFDVEKIEVAANNYSVKNFSGLKFIGGDITHPDNGLLTSADAFILYDVLHYLTPEQQYAVLDQCGTLLHKDGSIFIREGIIRNNKLKSTNWIEFLSTRIFRFNKFTDKLHFIDNQLIESIAQKHDLEITILHSSKYSSDTLIQLKSQRS